MKTDSFNYILPKELIAQMPSGKRDESRLLVLDRKSNEISHKRFYEIIDFLNPGDVLIINDTKVIPARIFGKDKRIREILLIKEVEPLVWETFIKPQRGLNIGEELVFNSTKGIVRQRTNDGTYILHFSDRVPFTNIGFAPLPPYIKRNYCKLNPPLTRALHASPLMGERDIHEYDKIRYQTVYAKNPGAIAAPTAGMHFTEELLEKIKSKGVIIAPLTLHVGIGTFRPVRTEYIKDHEMRAEYYNIPGETTRAIKNAKRVIAVGTTTVRALETNIEGSGYTNLFIYPPYEFKAVNGLITNFHLPKSTLLMLVSAFAGKELITKAYEEAIQHKYRFYSYGDAMLIL